MTINFKKDIFHNVVSIMFFTIGFFGLGSLILTPSNAQTAYYATLYVNGTQTSPYVTSDNQVDIYWFINGISSCQLSNQGTGALLGSYSHTPAQYGSGIPAKIVSVYRPVFSGVSQSVTYKLSCSTVNATTIEDTLTITYTQIPTVAVSGININQGQVGQASTNLQTQTNNIGPVNQTQTTPVNTVQTSSTNPSSVIPIQNTTTPLPLQHVATPLPVDLKINGTLTGSGGTITIPYAQSVTLSWNTLKTSGCTLDTIAPASAITGNGYYPYNSTSPTNSGSVTLPISTGMTSDFSRTYKMNCVNAGGSSIGSDTVHVIFDVPQPQNPNTSCQIDIDFFDVDQDDVYEDELDNDVKLSWASTSANNCAYTCNLSYEGNTYAVTHNNSNRMVNNITSDHTFILECYENGNSNNSVTSTEHVDYHSGGSNSVSYNEPDIVTLPAQQVGSSTARIRGTFDEGDCSNLETGFLLGTNTNSMALVSNYQSRSDTGTVTVEIQGLAPGTTYYYQHTARGCSNIGQGTIQSFQTTGSTIPYFPTTAHQGQSPYVNTQNTSTSITNTSGTSSKQQILVKEIAEDGTAGDTQLNVFDIGVGYVPESNNKVRGAFPSSLSDWLLILGLLGLLAVAGKFLHEAFDDPHDRHRSRY